MDKRYFYEVAIDTKTTSSDVFTYASDIFIPERSIVRVNFSNRKLLGFILRRIKKPNFLISRIKTIEKIIDFSELLDEKRVKLARIASQYYLSSLGKVIFWALPEIAYSLTLKGKPKRENVKIKGKRKRHFLASQRIFYQANVFERFNFYRKIIRETIDKDKEVLFLTPNLEHWIVKSLAKEFKGLVFSQSLKRKEQYLNWRKVSEGKVSLIIGSLKAIFVPAKKLGLIIVEDAGNPNYKQEQDPRVDIRFLAKKLALISNSKLVFGGMVPDPYTFLEIKNKKFFLKSKIKKPKIRVVDLSIQNKLIGFETEEEIKKFLFKNKKIIIFYNRLGFSQLSICRDCGFFEFHKGKLSPAFCPQCKNLRIKTHSFGLERIAYDLEKAFPQKKVALLFKEGEDKFGELNVASSFALRFKKEFDLCILGLAEIGLSLPDPYIPYKILHFNFEALSIGKKGIIQTFNPEHPLIEALLNFNFEIFYKKWFLFRRKMGLAPFTKEIKIFSIPEKRKDEILKKLKTFKEIKKIYELADLKEKYVLVCIKKFLSKELRDFLKKTRFKIDVDPLK